MNQEIKDRFDAFVKKKGLRKTGQRDAIFRAAFANEEHFTAEELLERTKAIDPNTSRATVYRTIPLLIEAGLLREIDLGGDLKHYDPNFNDHPDHAHLICVDCGKVIEFSDANLQVLEDCIVRRLGFRPSTSSLRIEACCEQLRQTGTCENLINARLVRRKLPVR
ncbi:transcriptional repressor [Sulfuriroseicoccus oceanibius]|uniref:Ferric uptake regulation protein n=2 Tax=Sulfuriroseicoccus oceanibius TaxID=2707525 RepID=A0A6B3LD47_9BACT|nr:transcriptional repressor [Sulfuriroseicoccus oceanibius]